MKTYFTSDLHLFHDREFIWKDRGFTSEEEMRNYYVNQWKEKITDYDKIYILGDFCLGSDLEAIQNLLDDLPGEIILIIGNHDTDRKLDIYRRTSHITFIYYATILKTNIRTFYLSHYITQTAYAGNSINKAIYNLHGHIHTKDKFYNNLPFYYNVSVDANDNQFVTLDEINQRIDEQILKNPPILETHFSI